MRAVLFDLDGTLADTAADIALALDDLRAQQGLATLDLTAVRAATASGTEALLHLAFGIDPHHADYPHRRADFLRRYAHYIGTATTLFPGVRDTLQALTARGLRWGIVTNKPEVLARRVLARLDLIAESACLIGGDTAARAKPYPDPLLLACQRLQITPADTAYVGDDETDMEAARAAGMPALAATFGYATAGTLPGKADAVLAAPADLLDWLDRTG